MINNNYSTGELLSSFALICRLSPKDTHGPIVKTGPTAGQNRSRNQNGRWRKKRSDAGSRKI